ncbi:MAG: hypothetical protein CMJ83_09790 [Planctomycetes bacterium]|nr:hypothetical protein [Planctomycetota bacterium]
MAPIRPGLVWRIVALVLAVTLTGLAQEAATDLGAKKKQRLKDDAADFWIYDDIEAGYAKAKAGGKPLLVSFRCVP